jgi:LEA14-like dessication related protein
VLVAAAIGGCQARKPIVNVHDVHIERITTRSLDVVFEFQVVNLNDAAVTLRELRYDMVGDEGVFAQGQAFEPQRVPARGKAIVHAPATINYRQLWSAIRQARSGGRGMPYELRYQAHFDVLGVPMDTARTHHGRVPHIAAPSVDFRTITPRENGVDVVLRVTNPNEFDLPVIGVSGSLKIGDRALVELQRCPVTHIPAGQTRDIVLPVRADWRALIEIGAAIRDRKMPQFDGEVRFESPASIRQMLLGRDQ